MKRAILMGKTGSGKTTLIQRIERRLISDEKTQMVVYHDSFIDTPGEYMEMRSMYRALIVTAADADVVALVHASTDDEARFPPQIASIFPKEVIGIVTKTDLADSGRDEIGHAVSILELAGAERIFKVSAILDTGVDELLAFLTERRGEEAASCATAS
jgi:ethanolamine utilization protein EutP